MNHLQNSNDILRIIRQKLPASDCHEAVSFMIETGLIEQKRVLRWIIKNEYFERIKDHRKNFSDVKLDLCVEYGVSRSFVDKVLYYYHDIRI